MPYITDWLEMPSASAQPGPSLFDPPALRSMGTKRVRLQQSIQAAQTQKMAAYQAQMRKMEMQKLAEDEARAVLPVLQSLDPTAPDYAQRRGQLLSQFPLSVENPAVSNVAKAHDDMIISIRNQQEAMQRENEEDQKMLAEDPNLQYLFTQKAKIEGPEAAMAAIKAQRFNDTQAARLIKLGLDPRDEKVKAEYDIGNGFLNKAKIDELEARKSGEEMRTSDLEKYAEAVAMQNDAVTEGERQKALIMINGLLQKNPNLAKIPVSALPSQAASDTGKPATGGAFTVTSKTTREEIAKLPSGTRITMPDGTVKFKK